jgi:hypothetical protein
VHGGQDPVEAAVAQQGFGLAVVPVGFAQLDARQDPQAREPFPAAVQAFPVAVQVEGGRGEHAVAGQLAPFAGDLLAGFQ